MKEYDRKKSRETSACATNGNRLLHEREKRDDLPKKKKENKLGATKCFAKFRSKLKADFSCYCVR